MNPRPISKMKLEIKAAVMMVLLCAKLRAAQSESSKFAQLLDH